MDQVHKREFMDLVHIFMDPGLWTWSMEVAHEPGVLVLYSPQNDHGSLNIMYFVLTFDCPNELQQAY